LTSATAGAEKPSAATLAKVTQALAMPRCKVRESEKKEVDMARLQFVEQMRETTSILK
jgi:hypothetical protein